MEKLNELGYHIHGTARQKGFYDNEKIVVFGAGVDVENPSLLPEKIALMHSELSEALEAWRDEDKDQVGVELADALIRILDTMYWIGFDIDAIVTAKMEKNRDRAYLHGRKRG